MAGLTPLARLRRRTLRRLTLHRTRRRRRPPLRTHNHTRPLRHNHHPPTQLRQQIAHERHPNNRVPWHPHRGALLVHQRHDVDQPVDARPAAVVYIGVPLFGEVLPRAAGDGRVVGFLAGGGEVFDAGREFGEGDGFAGEGEAGGDQGHEGHDGGAWEEAHCARRSRVGRLYVCMCVI